MNPSNIAFALITWVSALCFVPIALWAFLRKDPMHFWAGSTVKPEKISDIPAYNRANGIMWLIYAGTFILSGVIGLFSITAGVVLLLIVSLPGSIALCLVYKRIYRKYRISEFPN